jgi:hypothetical protein
VTSSKNPTTGEWYWQHPSLAALFPNTFQYLKNVNILVGLLGEQNNHIFGSQESDG